MKKPIRPLSRARLTDPEPILSVLEATEDRVWLSRTVCGTKYTMRGVPASAVDVLVTDDALDPRHPGDVLCVELSRKTGRYDGRERDRITLRRMPGHQVADWPAVTPVVVHVEADHVTVSLGEWERRYPALRASLEGYNFQRIVMWHWRRYFGHLDEQTARQEAELFEASVTGDQRRTWTLAEANRAASRVLYRASRDAGWIKLTLRERNKLGKPDASQWQEAATVARWRDEAYGYRATGCGDATHRAAAGGVLDSEPVVTEMPVEPLRHRPFERLGEE